MTPPQPRKETLSPRAAHGRPRWVVWGLCAALVIFLFALSSAVPSQSQLQPPKLKEEQLEALAVGLSLKPPDRGWEGTGESHR